MADPQADRVIDRIMAERQRALDFAGQQQGVQRAESVQEVEETVIKRTQKLPRRSEIARIIEEKGEVSPEDLQRLIAKHVRRGV